MRKSITLIFATIFAFASSAAYANEGYSTLDADKSGAISKDEAAALPGLADAWDTLDVNADGQLDEGEFAKFEVDVKDEAPTAK